MQKKSLIFGVAAVMTLTVGLLSGCADSGSPTSTTVTPKAATTVYVTNQPSGTNSTGQILVFSATATGSVTPTGTITLPTAFKPYNVATDSTGQIYVSGRVQPLNTNSYSQILIYAAGATTGSSPVRTITASAFGVVYGNGLAVDGAGNIYVTSSDSTTQNGAVVVYASTANGAAIATRVIQGAATGLSSYTPVGIAVDGSGNIYVAPYSGGGAGQILVYGAAASGNVAPIRSISGASTQLAGSIMYQLAVDTSGNLYVPTLSLSTTASSMLVFGPTASGNVAPSRAITGRYNDTGVAVDAAGNIYTYGYANANANGPSVSVFPATANGAATPASTFTSAAFNAGNYYNIAVY